MKQRPRLDDVASIAGVSPATVSRALSNPERVRQDTRERIEQAILQLGYVPDAAARALASGRTQVVGAIMPTLDNAIFARAVQGLQTTLAAAGYQLLIATHEYDPPKEQGLIRALLGHAIDGLVLVGAEHPPSLWEMVHASKVPLLVTWAQREAQPSLAFDNECIGRLAAEHLLGLGHRRFGMISGHLQHNDRARARLRGFRLALERAGITLEGDQAVEQRFGFDGGRLGLQALLRQPQPPSAIFCGNDVLALGCLLEAGDQGLSVPGDLSIVGCDNLPITEQLRPRLTTVSLPTQALGQQAAEMLLGWIASGVAPESRLLPVELVVRESTGPAPAT